MLRINSVNTLINRILIQLITVVPVSIVINLNILRIECLYFKILDSQVIIRRFLDWIIHWMRLLLVRIGLNNLINHLFLIVHYHSIL